jgi:hypothetical protein
MELQHLFPGSAVPLHHLDGSAFMIVGVLKDGVRCERPRLACFVDIIGVMF